jgi:transposase
LGIDASTVNRHYHHYQQSQDFDQYLQTHYKPYQGKLTEEQLEQVKTYVNDQLCNSSLMVKTYIEQQYRISYSQQGVVALLHRLGFCYKKTKLIPSKADLASQQSFVEQFGQLEKHLPADQVILFGDGVHPQHNTQASYGWIAKGKERTILSNSGRVRVNINGAINPHCPTQVVVHQAQTIDAFCCLAWLQLIEKAYPNQKLIHLFVDNARYYRSQLVQDYLNSSRIQMHFLPPYSPNLNPIERLWKLLKKEVINSHYTPDPKVFKQRIDDFFAHIGNYKEQLESLINTNFQQLKPA